jgi:hypothetical protein
MLGTPKKRPLTGSGLFALSRKLDDILRLKAQDQPNTICQNLPESTLTSAGAKEG